MTAATHTPGSWVATPYLVRAPNNGNADVVCECPQGTAIESRERWEANACLIAAAPDMLEALMGIHGAADFFAAILTGPDHAEAITRWRAVGLAITKATGAA